MTELSIEEIAGVEFEEKKKVIYCDMCKEKFVLYFEDTAPDEWHRFNGDVYCPDCWEAFMEELKDSAFDPFEEDE